MRCFVNFSEARADGGPGRSRTYVFHATATGPYRDRRDHPGARRLRLWLFLTAGRVSTDDAQVDAHVTQIAARVGGTVTRVAVEDNQLVDAGTVLIELDPRDYQVAVDKARAELADAEATAVAAQSNVPITSTTATSNVGSAQSSLEQARS